MTSIITNLYGSINRPFKSKKRRVRCLSIYDFNDCDEIELEMENNSLILIFFREFRIKRPIDAKRIIQRLNALTRQFDYKLLNLNKLDYFILFPKGYELTTEKFF